MLRDVLSDFRAPLTLKDGCRLSNTGIYERQLLSPPFNYLKDVTVSIL